MSQKLTLPLELWKERIKTLVQYSQRTPVAGEDWYLVSSKWWREALQILEHNKNNDNESFCGPGILDNNDLLENSPTTTMQAALENEMEVLPLKRHLQDRKDYILLPREGWAALCSWFGANCGPAIARKAIELEGLNRRTFVEVYPLVLKVICSLNPLQTHSFTFSKAQTLDYMKHSLCVKLQLEEERVKMFNYFGGVKREELVGNITLYQAHIEDEQEILLEMNDQTIPSVSVDDQSARTSLHRSELPFPTEGGVSTLDSKAIDVITSNGSPTIDSSAASRSYCGKENVVPSASRPSLGLVGLYNLGNTCFMNATLQCLSSTLPLTKYFLKGLHHNDINHVNPIGTKGKVAEQYAALLRIMWTENDAAVIPRELKWTIQEVAPQFADYHQHDAHELLAYLLDALHEDLNRAIVKPNQPEKRADIISGDTLSGSDVECAREAWQRHLARNDSIIVSLFHGQLKSRVQCPLDTCRHVSVTFDPFMYLSVPLPKDRRRIVVTLVRPHMTGTTEYVLRLPPSATVAHLLTVLAQCAESLHPEDLLLTKVFQHRFVKVYQDYEQLDAISDDDQLVAYDVGHIDDERPESDDEDLSGMTAALLDSHDDRTSLPPPCQRIILPVLVRVPQPISPSSHSPSLSSASLAANTSLKTPTTPMFTIYLRPILLPFLLHLSLAHRYSYSCLLRIAVARLSKLLSPPQMPPRRPLDKLCSLSICDGQGNTVRELDAAADQFLDLAELATHSYSLAIDCDLKLYSDTVLEILKKPACEQIAQQQGVPLTECFALFSAEERLTQENKWYCPKCRDWREATKKLDIWRLPPILIIHLKRFGFSHFHSSKVDTLVDFPLEGLDLHDFVLSSSANSQKEPLVYDLYAVINHFGSLGYGHYTAMAKRQTPSGPTWYHFDDTNVTEIDNPPREVVTSAVYILFYKRRDIDFSSTIL